jgi:predicted small secreted protein
MTSHNFFSSGHLRAAVVAALAALALALSGCNTGAGPDAADTASPAVSQTPTATPAPTPTATAAYVPASASGRAQNVPVPVLPEVAKTETKEGLEAFVAYWYATLSYAYETGDVALLGDITRAGCANCDAAKAVITNWYPNGRWLEGGKIVTPAIETTFKVAPDGNYQVIAQVQQSQLRAYKADGSVSEVVVPPSDVAQIFMATYSSGGWYVVDVQRLNG